MILRIIKQILSWGLALAVGFVIVNVICFAYERPVGWIDTPSGVSKSVRNPGRLYVHGTEGYSISFTDRNGFMNPDKDLADEYVLMLGASHSQGKEVALEKRYPVIVSDNLAKDDRLYAYSIATDSSHLTDFIKHFNAAVEAFPNSSVVTIEILSTDYSADKLINAIDQVEYDPDQSAIAFSKLSTVGKLKNAFKEYFPMLSMIKKNMETLKSNKSADEKAEFDDTGYEEALNDAMELIRSEYDGNIVFVYHPGVEIKPDGTMDLTYSKTWETFCKVCESNGIDVIDNGKTMLQYYNDYHKVPYGFANTSMGKGHLNVCGHEIVAKDILAYLEGLEN